ncbi:MAG: phosphatase PAP2 family protein [Lachnospiraceae bacterium]|nr:phosphatase PAP2 family protein [Lachnospiraceae bacterium]
MTKEKFLEIKKYMEEHSLLFKVICLVAKVVTTYAFVSYPLLLAALFVMGIKNGEPVPVVKTLFIPGTAFVLLSFYRMYKNSPRPYEVWETEPLIRKETKGNSFPSRHVFSITVIAMAYLENYRVLGVALLVGAVYLAVFRVITGVHFIKDVVAGAAIGVLAGLVLFLI